MLPHDLVREWLALPSPGAGDLRLLGQYGVTREAVHRAGGLAVARIGSGGRLWAPEPTGTPVFILPAWNGTAPSIYQAVERPLLVDLVAWRPDDPTRWWYRHGDVDVDLGADNLDVAHMTGLPISFATAPLEWLQGNCCGSCLLGYCEIAWWELVA